MRCLRSGKLPSNFMIWKVYQKILKSNMEYLPEFNNTTQLNMQEICLQRQDSSKKLQNQSHFFMKRKAGQN